MRIDVPIAVRPRRSFIFSPGLKPEMFPKAIACGADIVRVELEDGIAPKDKDVARANAIALFAQPQPQADDAVERIVRINGLRCRNAWEPLLYARSRVVHAAASVGIDAVVESWTPGSRKPACRLVRSDSGHNMTRNGSTMTHRK